MLIRCLAAAAALAVVVVNSGCVTPCCGCTYDDTYAATEDTAARPEIAPTAASAR